MTVRDAIEQAYRNGYEAGVKSVTDNPVGDKMTPTDKDINVLTNADRIRAMSDEELAAFIGHRSLCDRILEGTNSWCKGQSVCKNCMVEWLKQPAEVDNG